MGQRLAAACHLCACPGGPAALRFTLPSCSRPRGPISRGGSTRPLPSPSRVPGGSRSAPPWALPSASQEPAPWSPGSPCLLHCCVPAQSAQAGVLSQVVPRAGSFQLKGGAGFQLAYLFIFLTWPFCKSFKTWFDVIPSCPVRGLFCQETVPGPPGRAGEGCGCHWEHRRECQSLAAQSSTQCIGCHRGVPSRSSPEGAAFLLAQWVWSVGAKGHRWDRGPFPWPTALTSLSTPFHGVGVGCLVDLSGVLASTH